jgi:hypothetical protein
VKEDLEKAGHHVSLSFTTCKETMQNLDTIIIAEEAQRRKDVKIAGIPPGQRKDFVLQWKMKHQSQLFVQLGTPADNLCLKFLNGIFFAPLFVKTTVPHLQKVFMADACDLNFGKYTTLFSCYGITANSNASPVAFAIIFGNENTSTPINVMPMWWKRKQWRLQFPLDLYSDTNITMKSVKEGRLPDFSLRLCPDWTVGSKPGRSKKGERIKSGLETAMVKGKAGTKKTKATKRQRCMVCGKYGHKYKDCWLLEKSEDTEPVVVDTLPITDNIDNDGKEASV